MNGSALNIIASPPIAENWLWVLGLCAALALIALALWRPRGGMWRALAIAFSLAVLFGPAVSVEQRESKPDIALIIVDRTTSQNTGQRPDQTGAALETLETQLAQWPDVEWQVANVRDDPTAGSRLFTAISEHMGTIPQDQRAGVIMITDGQAHDTLADVFLDTTGRDGAPTPVHVLLTGDPEEHDRRLVIEEAPRFGIVNRTARVEVRLEDAQDSAPTELTIKRDDQPLLQTTISPGERRSFDLPITRRGDAMFTFSVATPPQDIAPANNQAFVPIRGVRERLRVLLVSGKPYAGTRVWRDLLKSDPSVDLVHFTILRSPDKQSFIAQNELSLISFPTQELFEEKLKEFDLVVFDGYWQRGLLTRQYLRNVADYVRAGGALLEVAGPYSATSLGLGRSGALGDVLTARTTGRVMVGDFRPQLTQLGRAHPVTGGLRPNTEEDDTQEGDAEKEWGRWFRHIEAEAAQGDVLMRGLEDAPLLILTRIGEGRAAQLMSDHIWLWARGHDGGGPYADLLRRLAHWLMQEPELEENALKARIEGKNLIIERRRTTPRNEAVSVTYPSGKTQTVRLEEIQPGLDRATLTVTAPGLYHLQEDNQTSSTSPPSTLPLSTSVLVGDRQWREYTNVKATPDRLGPLVGRQGGGLYWLATDGVPSLKRTDADAPAAPDQTAGQNEDKWMGLRRNGAYTINDTRTTPFPPAVVAALIFCALLGYAWWRESR